MHEPIKLVDRVQAINWNRLTDDKDLEVWVIRPHATDETAGRQ